MLSRFVIEPAAIANEPFLCDVATMKGHRDNLIEFWRDHGVWVHPRNSKSLAEWHLAIEALPVKLRQIFTALFLEDVPLRGFRTVRLDEDLNFDEAQSYTDLTGITRKLGIDLALLEPTRAIGLGLDDDAFCACASYPCLAECTEITRWHLVAHTCRIEQIKRLAGRDIKSDDNPKDIWNQRLRAYAEHSRDIIIGDPYCTYDLSTDNTHQHNNNLNHGLFNLLRYFTELKPRLDEKSAPDVTISIYATYENEYNANPNNSLASIKEALHSNINNMRASNSRIKAIHVYLAPSNAHLFHDRWLRFDHNAISLGKGVEVFNYVHTLRRKNAGDSDFQLKNPDGVASTQNDEGKIAAACNGLNEHFTIAIR